MLWGIRGGEILKSDSRRKQRKSGSALRGPRSIGQGSAEVEQLIRASGGRLTSARVAVLNLLLSSRRALTHHEICDELSQSQCIDRVTIYRVLDWLVSEALVHRIPGDDRVWRFSANRPSEDPTHQHAHFACTRCGQTVCLDKVSTQFDAILPKGFRSEQVELTIRGTCAHCGG
ncbi:MAG: Fur family transcriptional regulator [Burkholderiales bacterium]